MCLVGKCHPNRSSEDIPAFWRLTATIASCLSRTWPAGALVTHCYTLTFTGEFVKLAVGSIPVCGFDKSIGLLMNIPKQPNPWCHPRTPLPEIRGGLALVPLGFTPKMEIKAIHHQKMSWHDMARFEFTPSWQANFCGFPNSFCLHMKNIWKTKNNYWWMEDHSPWGNSNHHGQNHGRLTTQRAWSISCCEFWRAWAPIRRSPNQLTISVFWKICLLQ